MAVPLEVCTRKEQRAVIRFLGSGDVKRSESHRRMRRQHEDVSVSLRQVYEQHRKFKKTGSQIWRRQLTPGSLALRIRLTLTLKWNE